MYQITPGMARTFSRRMKFECPECGLKIPKYRGRYPKHCPSCDTPFESGTPVIRNEDFSRWSLGTPAAPDAYNDLILAINGLDALDHLVGLDVESGGSTIRAYFYEGITEEQLRQIVERINKLENNLQAGYTNVSVEDAAWEITITDRTAAAGVSVTGQSGTQTGVEIPLSGEVKIVNEDETLRCPSCGDEKTLTEHAHRLSHLVRGLTEAAILTCPICGAEIELTATLLKSGQPQDPVDKPEGGSGTSVPSNEPEPSPGPPQAGPPGQPPPEGAMPRESTGRECYRCGNKWIAESIKQDEGEECPSCRSSDISVMRFSHLDIAEYMIQQAESGEDIDTILRRSQLLEQNAGKWQGSLGTFTTKLIEMLDELGVSVDPGDVVDKLQDSGCLKIKGNDVILARDKAVSDISSFLREKAPAMSPVGIGGPIGLVSMGVNGPSEVENPIEKDWAEEVEKAIEIYFG